MSPILFLAIIPPLLWASVNHIDKYAVERFMKGRDPGALIIFTGIAAVVMMAVLALSGYVGVLPFAVALPMVAAGTMLVFSYLPYLYALERDEASNVAPLFQLITPTSYILALVFLHEQLLPAQLFSGVLIFSGALILSFDFSRLRIRMRSFMLMLLASVMIASNVVMFKAFALQTSFWATVFYDLVGAAFAGALMFLCIGSFRRTFTAVVREYRWRVIRVNMLAETVNIFARIMMGFVTLAVPIAVAQFVNGFQPLFILLLGILLSIHAPHLGKEKIDREALLQKFAAVGLMIGGFAMLSFFV